MSNEAGFQVSGHAAQQYQQFVVPHYIGPWARALVAAAGLAPGQTVLDAACGTGVVARLANEAVGQEGRVVGLDLNAGMLAVARAVPADPPAIEWVERDVADSGFDAGMFDVVLSQQGIQYFPDQDAALRELHLVLAPGGRLLLTVWKGHSPFTRALLSGVGRHLPAEWAHKMDAQRSPPALDTLRDCLARVGFRQIAVVTQRLTLRLPAGYVVRHLGSLPIASAVNGMNDADRDAFLGEIEASLQGYVVDEEIVVPDEVYLISGAKV